MKTRKKLAALCMILVLGLSCLVYGNSIHSYAASTQFSISLSSSSIQKGGSVTVTVSISCSEALGAYSYCLSYDSSLLEYQSGDGYGGGGTVSCAGYGDGNITSASNSFTFSAINTGSAYVSTGSSDVYTWGEEHAGASDAGATITQQPLAATVQQKQRPANQIQQTPRLQQKQILPNLQQKIRQTLLPRTQRKIPQRKCLITVICLRSRSHQVN